MIELLDEFFVGEGVDRAAGRAVVQGELDSSLRVMLPDELQHQQLVEIGVEQGSRDRVEFPVVVVRPFGEVHDHALISSYAVAAKANHKGMSEAGVSGEFKVKFALEEEREIGGFALDAGALCLGKLAKRLDVYEQPLALNFVRPDAGDRTID